LTKKHIKEHKEGEEKEKHCALLRLQCELSHTMWATPLVIWQHLTSMVKVTNNNNNNNNVVE